MMPEQSPDLEAIREHFAADRFAATSGVRILELRQGYASAELTIEERHLNSVGTVHGGAYFTLADLAFAMASNSGGKLAVALSTTMSFLKATRGGTLHAEANEVARSRRVSTCMVRVTDDSGQLVALFQGTGYIMDAPFPPSS